MGLVTSAFLSALVFVPSADACVKYFKPFKLRDTALYGATLKFGESAYGPTLKGLRFRTSQGVTTEIVYNAKMNRWCALQATRTSPIDCNMFYLNGTGTPGSGQMILVNGESMADDPPAAFAVHASNDGTLTISSVAKDRPLMPENYKSPFGRVDRKLRRIHVTPMVERGSGGQIVSTIKLMTEDGDRDRFAASHGVSGKLLTDGRIEADLVRSAQRSPPDDGTVLDQDDVVYTGPSLCGAGKVAKLPPSSALPDPGSGSRSSR